MKKGSFISLAAAMFAFALLFGACEKKNDQPAPSSSDTSQAPGDTKSPSDQSTTAPSSSSSPDTGSTQKPDDTSKAQKG